jgi:hypothetical protein
MGPFPKGRCTVTDASGNVIGIPAGPARSISIQNNSDFDVWGSPEAGQGYLGDGITDVDAASPSLPATTRAVVRMGRLFRARSDVTVDESKYGPHQPRSVLNNTPSQAWYFVTATGETAEIIWQRD